MPRFSRALAQATALCVLSTSSLVHAQQAAVSATQTVSKSTTGQAPATQPATQSASRSTTTTQPAATEASTTPTELNRVIVSQNLEQTRLSLAPALGAVEYNIGPTQIQNTPGGDNAPFQQVLLRAPGVVPDSFGAEHVRGEHANLTYRINGTLLPQPLESFAQELDTRLIQSASLITGSLPAQFGLHTAGIVDVTTKSGATLQHNELSIYGGSFGTLESGFQFGGTKDNFDYFVTGSYKHSALGLENPTASHGAIHDNTDQQRFFGYFSYLIDDTSRISLLINTANADFQIPDTPGLAPGFSLAGHSGADSGSINENQNQQEYYIVLAYQKNFDQLSTQLSFFTRYADVNFRPDVPNDLMFQGVAGNVFNGFLTNGVQFDASLPLGDQHTLRGGLIADYTCEKLATNTGVFDTDPGTGNQLSDTPRFIGDDSGNNALEAGFYLQDEWKITPKLTLNYGFRYDRFDSNFDHEGQVSPRINLVYKFDEQTTMHAGYSRYFVPPPVQDVHLSSLNKFQDTTNSPENFLDNPPRAERSNYFDVGITHQMTKEWQISLDGFYKQAHQLIDLGQFGAPVIEAPFNYRKGTDFGAEFSTTYTWNGLSLFTNLSWVRATGIDPDTQQFLWANNELAYAQSHSVILDHESEYTASAGISYAWKDNNVYLDFLAGSGLRSGFANTTKVPAYYPVNMGYEHTFHPEGWGKNAVKLRFDVVNVFDQKYEIRDGSGIGVGAAQFGERLGIFMGLAYEF